MTPIETIRLQALKLKATVDGSHSALVDQILENHTNQDAVKQEFRNVCALIPVGLFEKLESLCSLLDLSKREVINMALREFFCTANAIVKEVNPFENEASVKESNPSLGGSA